MQQTQPIIARAAELGSPVILANTVMWMPGGAHTITPSQGGRAVKVSLAVTPATAAAAEQQRRAIEARTGKRVYFSIFHDAETAGFWPSQFRWGTVANPDGRNVEGVVADGEWSKAGREAVEGKNVRTFSPRFFVDDVSANPASVICNPTSNPNMGAFENDPAFWQMPPLWARDAGAISAASAVNAAGANSSFTNQINMTPEQLAALQASIKTLEQDIAALKARSATDAESAKALQAKQAEHSAAQAQLDNEQLRAQLKTKTDALEARQSEDAKSAVDRAIKRGAILPQNKDAIAALEAKAAQDPGMIAVIDAMQGNAALAGSITPRGNAIQARSAVGGSVTGGFNAREAMRSLHAILARNSKIPLNQQTAKEKGAIALEASQFYGVELTPNMTAWLDMPLREAIEAADVTDANLGTLSGTLVSMRTLELFQYNYPLFTQLATDFSDQPGLFNQTENTRILVKPAVQTYDTTTDAAGRPKGWSTVSPATTIDVPIKLDSYIGIPIVFSQQTIASTARRLFDEQAAPASAALGDYFAQKITALMTPANFNAYAVKNGNFVPDVYATYVKALKDFSVAAFDDVEAIFDPNQVPTSGRFAFLTSPYYSKIRQDPRLNLFFAAQQSPEIVTKGDLPELTGFAPYRAPWLLNNNTTDKMTSFFGQKNAIVLKTRLPMDFTTQIQAMVPGSITTITLPATGFSVALVQYVSLRENYAEWRLEGMLGAAVGDRRAGLVGTSA